MSSIVGAIFPISIEHANRIFDGGRTIFVKFTTFSKLEKGCKIIFYISREKKILGEAVIKKIEKLNPRIAWSNYGNLMFLEESEFEEYAAKSSIKGETRKMSQITVFFLKDVTKYQKLYLFTGITPTGRYLTYNEYEKMVK